MDTQEVARGQMLVSRSSGAREGITIWDGVRVEDRCRPSQSTLNPSTSHMQDQYLCCRTGQDATGCRAARADPSQLAPDEMCRKPRILSELVRTCKMPSEGLVM